MRLSGVNHLAAVPDLPDDPADEPSDLTAVPSTGPQFAEFYRREYPDLVRLIWATHRLSLAQAEDICQDTFLAAHDRWGEIATFDAPVAWVRRVAWNKAASLHRRAGAEARAILRVAGRRPPEAPPEFTDHDRALWEAMRSLPRRQAQVLWLRAVGDLTTEQIATTLDIAEGSVRTHLGRARERLRAQLLSAAPHDARLED